MLAVMTRFARWIPTIDFDEGSSVPLRLVFQLANELTPSYITHGFCKTVILDHVLDCQTLYADHLVFANNASREFMLVVSSTVPYSSMHACYDPSCFLPVVSTFLFLGMPTLCFRQSFLIFCVVAGVAHSFTSRENHHRFETQVQPNLCIYGCKRFDLLFNEHGDKVAI